MRWSVFCRVVDNFGDIGFSWRLAADLASRGERVSLAVDDGSALGWLAPEGAAGVDVVGWNDDDARDADVVVETFGCGLPDAVNAAQLKRHELPVHVDVEHLTAEPFALRSHGLPSPKRLADGRDWPTWFYFPGFVPESGGLLQGPSLLHPPLDRDERRVFVFSYLQPAFAALVDALADAPTQLLLAPGAATEQARALLGPGLTRGAVRAEPVPFVTQRDFDGLLASCDLAFVRGEDSPVRALRAGVPFCWQLYPQHDRAHEPKLEAFLDFYLAAAPGPLAAVMRQRFRAWNGGDRGGLAGIGDRLDEWRRHATRVRDALAAQDDLASRLLDFVSARRYRVPR